MTTDDRRLKDARRDAIPADPPSPLTAEEIAMVRAASPDPASFTARLLATLDAARAPAPAGLDHEECDRQHATVCDEYERLQAAAIRYLDATVACRAAAESAVAEKGAAVAFDEGHLPLDDALEEFSAAEEALRAALASSPAPAGLDEELAAELLTTNPATPLNGEEIEWLRRRLTAESTTDKWIVWMLRLLATLDAATAPAPAELDVDLAASAAVRVADFFVPGEDQWISAIEFVKRWTAEYDALRAATSPAPATTNPRLIETDLVVPAPAGLDETARLLGYLWTATGRNSRLPVSDMFDPDDPIVADVERLAIFPDPAATRPAEDASHES